MRKEIIINAAADQTRIAITEDGHLAELFVETPHQEKMVGDIYMHCQLGIGTGRSKYQRRERANACSWPFRT